MTKISTASNRSAKAATAPEFVTIQNWLTISGMSRSGTYRELANGNLRAKKLASRTLVDVQYGLAWLRSLPAAEFRAHKKAA